METETVDDADLEEIVSQAAEIAIVAVSLISVAVLLGKFAYYGIQKSGSSFVLPPAVFAGVLGLGIQMAGSYGKSVICNSVVASWEVGLDLLVNCSCAALFFSFDLINRPFKRIWHEIIIQLMYGQIVSWGQYATATLVAILFSSADPVKYTPYMGTIVAMGMEGGQKTAWNLYTKGTFTEVHVLFKDAYAYAMAAANIGLLTSVFVGIMLLSWKKVWDSKTIDGTNHLTKSVKVHRKFKHEKAQKLVFESLAVHIGFISLSVGVSFAIWAGLTALEERVDTLKQYSAFSVIPIYPLCMLMSTFFMKIFSRCSNIFMNLSSFQHIATAGMEFIVAILISMLEFPVQTDESWTSFDTEFYVIMLACILWNLFCLAVVSRRMCPNFWFSRGLVEFGQSTGTFWMGMTYMAHLDPRMITPVPLAFTVKQLVHGSVLGGYAHMTFVAIEQYMLSHFVRYVADRGLFTTFSLQIEHQLGPWANFSISICCVAIWLTIFGLYYRHKFPNQTRLNLKKFNLLFQAVHNKLVNSRKVSKSREAASSKRLSKGPNSELPLSLRISRKDPKKLSKASSLASINDGLSGSMSPPDVELQNTLLEQDEAPDTSKHLLPDASTGSTGVGALSFFVENPVEIRGKSSVLKPFHFASLRSALSARHQLDNWTCIYNLQNDGASITRCLKNCRGRGPTVLVMEDTWGFVSGAFISAPWKSQKCWFGTGETFCFTFEPSFEVFKWTGANENFVCVDPDKGLGFGSGGGFALWFDASFENASTARCQTFDNRPLASNRDFGCITVEVWELGT